MNVFSPFRETRIARGNGTSSVTNSTTNSWFDHKYNCIFLGSSGPRMLLVPVWRGSGTTALSTESLLYPRHHSPSSQNEIMSETFRVGLFTSSASCHG